MSLASRPRPTAFLLTRQVGQTRIQPDQGDVSSNRG
jgi:hypothetical protein